MSASRPSLTTGLTLRQLRWLAVGAAGLVLYAVILLWSNVSTRQDLREAARNGIRLEAEKRAGAVAYFLDERRNDLADLAASSEVQAYFANAALGMAPEYGLRASLLVILERLERLRDGKRLAGAPIYRRLVLLDAEGTVLAATERVPPDPSRVQPLRTPEAALPQLDFSPATGEIAISAPVRYAGRYAGQVIAWTGAEQLRQNFLASGNGGTETLLLTTAGLPALGPARPALPAGLAATLGALRPGQFAALPAGALGADSPAGSIAATAVAGAPFTLLTLARDGDDAVAGPLLGIAAAVPVVLAAALLLLIRLYRANRALLLQASEAERQRGELNVRYADLEQEVRRRQEVEQRLWEQRQQLADKTDELQRAMDEAHYLAHYDGLTDLGNRALFRESMRQALARSERHHKLLAAMFIDLDHFKRINDTLGHSAGDQLLRDVARRLEHSVRGSDFVGVDCPWGEYHLARQGGDEFTILLADLESPLAAGIVARRILNQLAAPINLDGNDVVVTASIGISLFPDDGGDVDTLLKNADVAMYCAKESGRNQYRFFEAAMQARAVHRLALESSMRRGIEDGQFALHYQPQVDAASGELLSFEALMRWRDPERGLVPPDEFIPVAEETGLIVPLTEFALRQVCRDIVDWQQRYGRGIRVAVNVSGRVIELTELADLVTTALASSGVPARLIEVELTESVLMQAGERSRTLLERLRELGVRVSIDDFGTGYSSLAYLKALPIDVLKIDRSFVGDVCTDANSATIARTIIAMARNLGLAVVAEGVETAEQRDFLRAEQCQVLQGYLFGRPMPAEAAAALLAPQDSAH